MSDKSITVKSDLLNPYLWEPENQRMADRGLTVGECLTPLGVKLITPSFLKEISQFNEQESFKTEHLIFIMWKE